MQRWSAVFCVALGCATSRPPVPMRNDAHCLDVEVISRRHSRLLERFDGQQISEDAFRDYASSYPPSAAAMKTLDGRWRLYGVALGVAVAGNVGSLASAMSNRCYGHCETDSAIGLAASWLFALVVGIALQPPADAEREVAEAYNEGSGGCRAK
jgi:hypothetical protein